MRYKVLLLLLLAILTAGCGANAAENAAEEMADSASAEAVQSGQPSLYAFFPETRIGEASEGETDPNQRWFRFLPMNHEMNAPDGTMLLFENYDFPEFTARDSKTDSWGNEILQDYMDNYRIKSKNLLEYAEDAYREYPDSFYSFSNYLNFEVERNDDQVISLLTLSSIYSGGTHPTSIQMAYNMDLQSRKALSLEDLIVNDHVDDFIQMVLDGVDERFRAMGEGALYDGYQYTIFNALTYGSMTPYWYFGTNGLVIFFNQYEIGPYASGIIKVELTYDQLRGIIREEYIPAATPSGACNMRAAEHSAGKNFIPVNEAEGSLVLAEPDATAYRVKVYQVSWYDNLPVAKRLMFALNRLNDQDVLVISGVDQLPDRSYCIEYLDGDGILNSYYVTGDGLEKAE